MSRTPEQVEADEALTAAIERVMLAYVDPDVADPPMVLTEYVVVSAYSFFDDSGVRRSAIGSVSRDGDVSVYQQLGLLDYRATRLRALITWDERDSK